jgi:O-antigen ligase
MPISLDPNATWRAFLSLIPAAAIFLAVLAAGPRVGRLLVVIVLAVAGISIILDVLQMIGGPESGLRFYAITNEDRAVGFFANANHNAAFLCAAIPFAIAAATALVRSKRHRQAIGVALLLILLAGLVMALALTRSRAGIVLGVFGGLSGIALAWQLGQGEARRRFLLAAGGTAVVAALIGFQFGFVNLAQRAEDSDLSKDLRWTIASATSRAVLANLPFGSGVGTFVAEYDMFAPRDSITSKYVNRAHNDWLEASLEGGVLAVAVAATFLVWFGWMSARAWRAGQSAADGFDILLQRGASVVIVLLLLHSVVDYPLRTTAMTVVFALCCGLLVPAEPEGSRVAGSDRRARGRTYSSRPIDPESSA